MSFETENIRNVVLLGHSGSGKTSFAECMLFEGDEIKRIGSISNNTTTSDFTNIEQDKGNSIFSTLMHVSWKDSKINILDTPGSDDFIGEVISSLKVADTALMVINTANGVEVGTEIMWEYIQDFQTPTLFVFNQLDHDKADFDKTLEQAQNRFGSKVIPVQYPTNAGTGFNTIIDALRMTMYVFDANGGKPEKHPIPESEMAKAKELHNILVEAAAENDDKLMEKYFEKGTLDESELAAGLTIAMSNQEIYPVFCCSSTNNMGSGRIMGFINDICPSPADCNPARLEDGGLLKCSSSGDTSIFIFKSMSEPQVGMVTYFKVYSGKLSVGDELVNSSNRNSERINQIFLANGKVRTATNEVKAGDIAVTVKLKDSHTNDTLNIKGVDRSIDPIHFPSPRIRGAVVPPEKASDMEKLMKYLHQIAEEDPTLIIEQSAVLKQTILHGQGQLHLDLIRYRIEKVNGLVMEYERPRIPYRETITKVANSDYRHKKQSGGSGQFAEVHMRIEPYYEGMPDPDGLTVRKKEVEDLEWGGKFALYWCIVGGSIDAKYINAIKKGIMQKMEEGPLTGSRCQDIRVSIYDGKMHAVDSNDMAFMIAATYAFKNGFKQAGPQLMEPIYDMEILCQDAVMGDVMGDLQTRRAMIQGMEASGHYQKILAKVPLSELYQYSSTLRSISQGRAKFTREFAEYMPLSHDLQDQLIKEYKDVDEE